MKWGRFPTISVAGGSTRLPSNDKLHAVGHGMVGMTRNGVAAFVTAVGLLLAACQPSGFTYVRNTKDGAYVKFPSTWHYFDDKDILERQAEAAGLTPGRAKQLDQLQWAVAFDADPNPSLDHLFNEPNGYPLGYARVRLLDEEERDLFSLASLRNEFIRFDEIAQSDIGRIEMIKAPEEMTRPDGLRGLHMRFTIRSITGAMFTYDQTAFVDGATQKAYLLVVGCTVECFEDHKAQIEQIITSWTIKEPQV